MNESNTQTIDSNEHKRMSVIEYIKSYKTENSPHNIRNFLKPHLAEYVAWVAEAPTISPVCWSIAHDVAGRGNLESIAWGLLPQGLTYVAARVFEVAARNNLIGQAYGAGKLIYYDIINKEYEHSKKEKS